MVTRRLKGARVVVARQGRPGEGLEPGQAAEIQAAIASLPTDYYQSLVIDALIAAEVDAVNARPAAWPMVPGQLYSTFTHGVGRSGSIAGTAIVAERVYFVPLYVPATTSFDRIGITITTAGAGGSTMRLGIFTLDLASGLATRVLDAGAVSVETTGDKELTIDQELQPGWYWLAFNASAACSVQAATAASGYGWSTSGAPFATRVRTSAGYGAYGATVSTNTNSGTAYGPYLRAA